MSAQAPPAREDLSRVEQALDEAVRHLGETMSELLRMVAELDDNRRWRRDGATNMAAWLAGRYGLAWGTAKEWVRVAHAVSELPELADAHRRGRVSWDQLRPLASFVDADSDAYWADRGSALRPWTLWREAKRRRRARLGEAQDAWQRRYLALHWDHDLPLLHIEGTLPSEEGAILRSALERRMELAEGDGPKDVRMADALVQLAAADPGDDQRSPTIVVHAGVETLAGAEPSRGPWLAETEGGQRLTSDAVRRLACDARVEWVTEARGRVVGAGRQGRVVPGRMLRILRHRDGGCRFPGCERRQWLQAHHLTHWADGGPTTLENLALMCHAHHRLLHEGGWKVVGKPDEELRFYDPRGRSLKTAPAVLAHAAPP